MVSAVCALVLGQLVSVKPDAWDVKVRYPRYAASGAATRRANAVNAARERAVFRTFVARAKRESAGSPGPFTLEVTPHRITDRPGLASGYVERMAFTGGAHPAQNFEAMSFGPKGRLVLRDLFRPGADARGEASRAILAVLKGSSEVPSNVASGDWKGLTREQAERFVVGPKGILFLFDPYELGSGAEGPRTALVPFSRLPGLDRRGVIRSVL